MNTAMAWQFWRRDAAQHTSHNMPQTQPSDEDRLRTVARRRLMGAAVLVTLTVLIFPWVFKQQPRPINDDLIIEVPRKEAAKPWANGERAAPATTAPLPAASVAVEAPLKPAVAAVEPPAAVPEPEAKVVAPVAAVVAAVAATAVVVAKPSKPEPKPVAKAIAKPEAKPLSKPVPKPEAALNAASQTGRFVVQVAAFGDASKARDTRIKLEAQGYKTYSQAIDSPKGKVWRVRVGPYGNKAEADKAKAQLTGKGFTPALLEL